uniref:Pentatricopeptide repeat-containing protein At3g13150-like n=1 Tax=Nicotiana sylvestris TaxID=4096 RepID=A0A1U7VLY4_NICSY|nr:PREDICTED: pentatricopeptide repeat-containing protein At3g13150-like [Nicotiana sylvestris]
MSYSLYRRLHNVFTNTAKSQVLAAIADAKPKVPPPFNPISEPESSKEQKFRPLIRKFKYLSKDPRFRCRHVNYESFVRRLSRTQQFSAIEDILEHQKIYPEIEDEGFVVRLISLYGKAGMFEQARRLFDEMPELNCERTIISFNALLAACVNSKKYDKISEIFRELPGKLAIEPDVISYNTVIKALCEMDAFHKNNMSSEAEKMWTLMEKKNVISNVRSYNSRIRWLVENNQVVEAEELFEEMKNRGINPDTYIYNSMIKACAKDGNLELAKIWYVMLEENGCAPNRPTFKLLITLACDKDDPDSAYDLCKKCINLKLNVFTGTIQRVVDALVDHSMIEEAKELLEIGKNCPFRYKLSMPNDLQ